MAAKQPIVDPKVRRALMLVGVMLLAVIILAVWNYISNIGEGQLIAPTNASADERLVVIDGDTMIVEPEGLGEAMTGWLKSPKGRMLSFELSDKSFQPSSAAPSRVTETRIGQVAGLTKANPTLMIHILQPMNSESVALRKLDEQRASRLRDEIVASGVGASQVTIENERVGLPTQNSPHLAVLLTK